MNIEEKRKKLDTFCENQVSCSKCLLEYFRIGRACQFNMYSDEDIEEAYKIVFTGKDNYKTLESKDNNTYKSLTDRKIKAVDPHIIVDFINPNTNEPYYSIKYYDIEEGKWNIGYSSYELKFVLEWLNSCFEVIDLNVQPIKKGKWIALNDLCTEFECSECNTKYTSLQPMIYCSNCGAKNI